MPVCLEEGTQSAWLYELLKPHVAVIVVSGCPREARCEERRARRLDACERAAHGNEECTRRGGSWAALSAAVPGLRLRVTDVSGGQEPPEVGVPVAGRAGRVGGLRPREARRIEWLSRCRLPYQRLASWTCREIDELLLLREEAEAWLQAEARAHPIIRKLSTVPGMGPIREPRRGGDRSGRRSWRASLAVRQPSWSYAGLGIIMRTSAEVGRERGGERMRSPKVQTRGLSAARGSRAWLRRSRARPRR